MRKIVLVILALCFVPGVFSQTAGNSPVLTATITLTSAQLLSLHGTPVQLIAAPGAGKAIVPMSVVFQYKTGATPYTVDNASHMVLYLDSQRNSISQISAISFLGQQGSQLYISAGIGGVGVSSQSTFENAALTAQNDSPAEWTGGDGTVTITIYYTVVSLQ